MQNLPDFGVDTPWAFLALLVTAIFGTPAILSAKMADKFGLLGVVARWWQRRKKAALDEAEALRQRHVDDLMHEIRRVDQARKDDARRLEGEIEQLRASDRQKHEYIVWITSVMRGIEVWAADRGLTLPPPPFMTLTEWLAKKEAKK